MKCIQKEGDYVEKQIFTLRKPIFMLWNVGYIFLIKNLFVLSCQIPFCQTVAQPLFITRQKYELFSRNSIATPQAFDCHIAFNKIDYITSGMGCICVDAVVTIFKLILYFGNKSKSIYAF